MINFFRKYHKWLGIIFTLLILLFAITGIILNHREFFSGIDISRNYLPQKYKYNNWNNASLRGSLELSSNKILFYGNVGVWISDSSFTTFINFNKGFPKGSDNHKIYKLFKSKNDELFAGTLFGLFKYDFKKELWRKINLKNNSEKVIDIIERNDTLLVLSRSNLFYSTDYFSFKIRKIPKPEKYTKKVGLFKTVWLIHSGEIFGKAGKIVVDIIGAIFIFLTITGLIFFVNGYCLRRDKTSEKTLSKLKRQRKWNLRWHNKIGWTTVILLFITTFTGIFLRPPLIITLVGKSVPKIPFSKLDNKNFWQEKLLGIKYDEDSNQYIIATNDGFYFSDNNFIGKLKKYKTQPPISLMGVNAFSKIAKNKYLVGSFKGLYLWDIQNQTVVDYITGKPYKRVKHFTPPVGRFMVAGLIENFKDSKVYLDFYRGVSTIEGNYKFPEMPQAISNDKISLWNLALEIHTGRIYKFILGDWYILVVPISGIFIIFILISGIIVWYKKHRKK